MPFFQASNQATIHYETYGDPEKQAVILIHGLASDLDIWKPQIVELKQHFHVIALDLPGHGKSGRLPHYILQDLPFTLNEFLDYLNLPQAHFMGLSIGATVCLLFAMDYPSRSLSLVLQGPSAGIVPFTSASGWLAKQQLLLTLNGVFLLWDLVGREVGEKIINWFGLTYQYSALLTGMHVEVDKKAMVGYALTNDDNPYRGRLSEIKTPVLILRGLEDQFERKLSQYIKDQVSGPCYWLEMPQAQHLVGLEKPVEFNLAATAFLAKVKKAKTKDVVGAANEWRAMQRVR
jgi:3-oxoadipate enol-lactonase